ncbi:MAG: energy transducer TonB [Allosphingosinicella sp.]
MARIDQDGGRERIGSALAVAALHAALGYALLAGFGISVPAATGRAIKLFDVAPPPTPPPPPEEKPDPVPAKAAAREGAAAPADLKARPSPVTAPPPRIRIDPPPRATVATVPGDGAQPAAGAADRPGKGSGQGGSGIGGGSGRSGNGLGGGGGVAIGARLIAGRIRDSDYPPAASRAGATGTVVVHLSVDPDGRVGGCRIARSSGSAELDEATCRLARQRFRYRPASDSQGRPVADTVGWKQTWWREAGRR